MWSVDTYAPRTFFFNQKENDFHLYTLYNKNKPKSDDLMMELGKHFFRVSAVIQNHPDHCVHAAYSHIYACVTMYIASQYMHAWEFKAALNKTYPHAVLCANVIFLESHLNMGNGTSFISVLDVLL